MAARHLRMAFAALTAPLAVPFVWAELDQAATEQMQLAPAEHRQIPEIVVVDVSPMPGAAGLAMGRLPFVVQRADAEALRRAQALDITEYLQRRISSVSFNSAQNNPLQPDIQLRGFTASPLLGLAQGLSVYQNGARINEPLGDSVNWDLLPQVAISQMTVISGANPIYGLNTLGGALAIEMKDGFSYEGGELSYSTGSWDRQHASLQIGANNGRWGFYGAAEWFDEDGWRDESPSDATNVYAALSWRDEDRSSANLGFQYGDSDLIGNGALPVGLVVRDREAIFTAPDITANRMSMVTFDASHFINENLQLAGSAFYRRNKTRSFNGDATELALCEFAGGGRALLDDLEDVEDALEDVLGIEIDDMCEGGDPAITSFADLEALVERQALARGLDPEDFELEDISDELSGTGILSDEAINNISKREQRSGGFDLQAIGLGDLFDRDNHLVVGISYYFGKSDFDSITELAGLNPVTRSTAGLGTGTFIDDQATHVKTRTDSWSLYLTNTHQLTPRLSWTLAGRYNRTEIELRDRSGERPELNGDHTFQRFNPATGLTYALTDNATLYASYAESSRAPTPIELACNQGVFEVARRFAEARGDDPEDIDFECRLPNAFLADPPLDQVVVRSLEAGVRGSWNDIQYRAGLFRSENRDDIIFQTTGRATGLFGNVDKTRRQGAELAVSGQWQALDWFASYSYLEATFEAPFMALSPNHPSANSDGEIQVRSGDRIPGLPEHQFKLGGDWSVTDQLIIGAEMIYNSGQYLRGDESNELSQLGGYTVVNLHAAWRFHKNMELTARVTNLFDKEFENFGLLGEDPDEVIDDLNDERPIFVGVGAPRGAWVGLRIIF
ncbi:MAG: TonB-dependent receptor [Spongiibacteraceae bacterium]|nr:TonB-dependent receptor [Spongiibacteraceae bacterium]